MSMDFGSGSVEVPDAVEVWTFRRSGGKEE
jgi:hypothetical protein